MFVNKKGLLIRELVAFVLLHLYCSTFIHSKGSKSQFITQAESTKTE